MRDDYLHPESLEIMSDMRDEVNQSDDPKGEELPPLTDEECERMFNEFGTED